MPFHFHKPHKSPKQTHSSEELHPTEEHPISIINIDLSGKCSRIETSYSRTAPSHQHNENTYHIPPLIAETAQKSPTNTLRLLTLEFTRDYIPLHKKDDPIQQALCGVYCLWYQEKSERPRTVKEYVELEGEFWIVRQLQWRPEKGEVIEYENVPEGMEGGMEGWWGRGVVGPKMRAAVRGTSHAVQ
ncbi:hypothetical protein JMJ35_003483 [Cladonia borealis]|uniref:Uncharacterized protein n=1 Tax=Cladonia borealis TaxID=184061 RepID=A0AA39UBT6_9LECA|nr:hypothetical protein JMJ35_003483 [Cladonia borealis]